MFKLLVIVVSVTVLETASGLVRRSAGTEYIENGDMESSFEGNWECRGNCALEESSGSLNGDRSAKITNRTKAWKGLSQYVNITGGLRYKLTGNIKLLNTVNNALFQSVDLVIQCQDSEGEITGNVKFGRNSMVQPGIWTELGAILTVPADQALYRVYVKVDAFVDYVADDFSLTDVPDLTHWKAEANERIEQLRKVQQIHGEFPFGSAVDATYIVGTENSTLQKYQNFFYEHFEFGGYHEALQWKSMEETRGDINYERPWIAMNAMREKGIKLRGHAVVGNSEEDLPSWVVNIADESDLTVALANRFYGVAMNASGLLEQWDVNNGYLHGVFFENRTRQPNITMRMFEFIHGMDPHAKLFFNDYEIIETRSNRRAWATKVQAQLFKDAGIPIGGLGVQSHIKNSKLDPTAMKYRLDEIAKVNLPIWITEFTVEEWDETKKDQALVDALTLYFSHPAVDGIVFGGFWDGKMDEPSCALVEGPDMIPNAAGHAYQTLFKETWRTRETIPISDTTQVSLRGFKGDYTVTLKAGGTILDTRNVTLGSNGISVEFDLSA